MSDQRHNIYKFNPIIWEAHAYNSSPWEAERGIDEVGVETGSQALSDCGTERKEAAGGCSRFFDHPGFYSRAQERQGIGQHYHIV